jgi:hypothetical protein
MQKMRLLLVEETTVLSLPSRLAWAALLLLLLFSILGNCRCRRRRHNTSRDDFDPPLPPMWSTAHQQSKRSKGELEISDCGSTYS